MSSIFPGKICRHCLHILEKSLVELAIRVFPEEVAMYGISPHRTPSMADSQVGAVQAVFLQDQLSDARDLERSALDHLGELVERRVRVIRDHIANHAGAGDADGCAVGMVAWLASPTAST